MSDTGMTGGGGGGTGMSGPYQQQQQNTFNSAVKRNANATVGQVGATTSTVTDTGHGTAKNPTIYMGAGSRIAYMGQDQAQQMYYSWDNKTRNKFLSQLSLAGYKTDSLKDAQLAALWAGYVEVAGKYSLAGRWVSPWEVIGKDISQAEGGGAGGKPKTVTQTQKSYNISTAEDAHALFQGAAQTLLGRDPTKAEIARFKGVLNKFEQATPTITTTTSNYAASGDLTSQTSKTTGGVSAGAQQLMAEEEAKKNPEYGAYQAATNGMNWLMEMIGGG